MSTEHMRISSHQMKSEVTIIIWPKRAGKPEDIVNIQKNLHQQEVC